MNRRQKRIKMDRERIKYLEFDKDLKVYNIECYKVIGYRCVKYDKGRGIFWITILYKDYDCGFLEKKFDGDRERLKWGEIGFSIEILTDPIYINRNKDLYEFLNDFDLWGFILRGTKNEQKTKEKVV